MDSRLLQAEQLGVRLEIVNGLPIYLFIAINGQLIVFAALLNL